MSSTSLDTRILLLRHAETTTPHLFHGAESDVAVSESGLALTADLAARLATLAPACTYSSGLKRAIQTAEIIAHACNTPHHINPALHERKMGPLSGQIRDHFWEIYDETRTRWAAGQLDFTHEGGESFQQVSDRVLPALQEIAAAHPGQTIAVVAHGIVIRVALIGLVDGYTPARFPDIPIPNLGIHDLTRPPSGPWRLAPGPTLPPPRESREPHW